MSRPTERLDRALVARGLAETRSKAAALIGAGQVQVDGRVCTKPAQAVSPDELISVVGPVPRVSRAGHKLHAALDALGVDVSGVALDAGASTGGFTQVLLERGCAPVYAVDVGHGQLHPQLVSDPRVRNLERLNLRELTIDHLDSRLMDIIVADVSFISLRYLLAPLFAVANRSADIVVMVKPQFEVGRAGLNSHGVVADPVRRETAIEQVIECAAQLGRRCAARVPSPLAGHHGNREEFVHLVTAEVTKPRTPTSGRSRKSCEKRLTRCATSSTSR